MSDLDLAKGELYEEQQKLVIVKNSSVLFQTTSHRINGFLDAIEKCGDSLEGASVADRVVGKAAALLCIYAKIEEVYAVVLSRKAQLLLKENNINCQWKELVENVLDANKESICPFEKAATNIFRPDEAYHVFKNLRNNLKQCK